MRAEPRTNSRFLIKTYLGHSLKQLVVGDKNCLSPTFAGDNKEPGINK